MLFLFIFGLLFIIFFSMAENLITDYSIEEPVLSKILSIDYSIVITEPKKKKNKEKKKKEKE